MLISIHIVINFVCVWLQLCVKCQPSECRLESEKAKEYMYVPNCQTHELTQYESSFKSQTPSGFAAVSLVSINNGKYYKGKHKFDLISLM